MDTISLAICGVPITIVADSPELTDHFAKYFRYYRPQVRPSSDDASNAGRDPLRIELKFLDGPALPAGLIPPQAKLFSQIGLVGLWREKLERPEGQGGPAREQFYFDLECAVFRVDPEAGEVTGVISRSALSSPQFLADSGLWLPLLLLLRSRGIYHLQAAAAVSPGGRLWLIAGAPRAGKTTLTLALGLAGWRPISDDSLLVGFNGSTAHITALKKEFRVEEGLFRRWQFRPGRRPGPQDPEPDLLGGLELFETLELADAVFERVDYLVLPQLVKESESRLAPVAESEALLRLAEQSLFFQCWREHVERQWQSLLNLARRASCYRLWAGPDLLDHPRRIAELFGAAERSTPRREP
ncbi:MAG TPA: hypothetical protein VJ302_32995 [Blastocatellia bacterium]|nr:hypothetical protein [Blastocatellia bacterium]